MKFKHEGKKQIQKCSHEAMSLCSSLSNAIAFPNCLKPQSLLLKLLVIFWPRGNQTALHHPEQLGWQGLSLFLTRHLLHLLFLLARARINRIKFIYEAFIYYKCICQVLNILQAFIFIFYCCCVFLILRYKFSLSQVASSVTILTLQDHFRLKEIIHGKLMQIHTKI